jgi:hypothetical protein
METHFCTAVAFFHHELLINSLLAYLRDILLSEVKNIEPRDK